MKITRVVLQILVTASLGLAMAVHLAAWLNRLSEHQQVWAGINLLVSIGLCLSAILSTSAAQTRFVQDQSNGRSLGISKQMDLGREYNAYLFVHLPRAALGVLAVIVVDFAVCAGGYVFRADWTVGAPGIHALRLITCLSVLLAYFAFLYFLFLANHDESMRAYGPEKLRPKVKP